jgi:hypothetical protein
MPYPWYETLANSNEIRQGDFIPECPILLPPTDLNINVSESEEIAFHDTITVQTFNTIVVSQSCDLENNKLDIVLVCPILPLEEFFDMLPESDRSTRGRAKKLEALKQGNLPSYHLLNRDVDSGVEDFHIVEFRNVYGVNFSFLKSYAQTITSRARLLPPYREHLSQAFARFFMRVGLPNDITDLQ